MSLSSALWTSTGIIHCLIGAAIPELREPLMRVIVEGTVQTSDMADRYEREATVWFQVAGFLMIFQGYAWKQYIQETRKEELPRWWGWSLTLLGGVGVKMMPQSGFWLVLAQGLRILYRSGDSTKKIK
jgi:hypothetical protein|uniref:Uncharacterized protein n=1 Tax=Attheya septentrionalis TaxID=420275 RepID=A0A7S2UI94_9STRA|mmetsp:Transcript_26139/g.47430  ORF Transcript_26139/g.47430 Transcript_26139/m.47430 type:complete len:128 (+) Transcript_26139:106-489(+)|eukprot:CAMPEP_0198289410 /NCGR_PEP_ID=MMETSP1449-20131203/7591_1 /TAXON_ID=420275 /ORGANISM="Attheya septentrionalis, Strain CCMP2084" /LENGTH=127 /DNA_ID=CAMNT_0043987727 /DNA_START=94 /DNA_END=477 /DNA_ORIENTATION=+